MIARWIAHLVVSANWARVEHEFCSLIGAPALRAKVPQIRQLLVFLPFGHEVGQNNSALCNNSEFSRDDIIPQGVAVFAFALECAESSRAPAECIGPSRVFRLGCYFEQ
jgi:hypothetical protein